MSGSRIRAGVVFLAGVLACSGAAGETNTGLANVGTGVAIALPIAAAGISYWKNDWQGIGQLALDTGATVGTALLLKQFVKDERPDFSDNRSFPSDTAREVVVDDVERSFPEATIVVDPHEPTEIACVSNNVVSLAR